MDLSYLNIPAFQAKAFCFKYYVTKQRNYYMYVSKYVWTQKFREGY